MLTRLRLPQLLVPEDLSGKADCLALVRTQNSLPGRQEKRFATQFDAPRLQYYVLRALSRVPSEPSSTPRLILRALDRRQWWEYLRQYVHSWLHHVSFPDQPWRRQIAG